MIKTKGNDKNKILRIEHSVVLSGVFLYFIQFFYCIRYKEYNLFFIVYNT